MRYDALTFLQDLFQPDPTIIAAPAVDVEHLDADWRVWFEERAAIMEYDGGLSREHAEAEALAQTIREMAREAAGVAGRSCQHG